MTVPLADLCDGNRSPAHHISPGMKDTKGRRRFIDYPRQGREGPRRWLPSWRLLLGTSGGSVAALAGLFAVVYATIDIPGENSLARKQATVYYWADGSQMVSVGAVNRQSVALGKVPDSVEHSVIAAENATFYTDSGVSLKGIARAVINMVSGEEAQGGSTITQQFVKNTYLSQDRTVTRKVKEFIISLKINNQQPKQEILRGYLNTSWFGRGSYGIQAAAHAYYGIDAKDLDAGQGAVLAALLKGSEQYDPGLGAANHRRSVARWKWILDRQVDTGWMSRKERAKYRKYPEPLPPAKPTSQAGQTGYLVDVANKFIKSNTGLTDKDLARGGYRIHTTFDKARTRQLEKAVTGVRKKTIDPKKRAADRFAQFGAASVRPEDGAVVALYGGTDATQHFSNNADTAAVPAGSAFKPFVLAAALQQQADQPVRQPADAWGQQPQAVRPPNAWEDLTGALVKGQSPPFVQAGRHLGLPRIRDLAVKAGLHKESLAQLEPTFPLGTSVPSAIRMASAYTTFTGGGLHADPYAVSRMTLDGKPVDGFARPAPERVVSTEVAQQVTAALEGVGWRILGMPEADARKDAGRGLVNRPVAAGATEPGDRLKSAWFVAGQAPPASGDGNEPITAVTLFRNKPGTPDLLPMEGVGGSGPQRGTTLPPKVWSAYRKAVS